MSRTYTILRSLIPLILAILLIITTGQAAQAVPTATYYLTVDTLADTYTQYACSGSPNDCSLRGAIRHANGTPAGSEIHISIPAGTYSLAIAGDEENANVSGDLDVVNRTVFLEGAGRTLTILAGASEYRVLDNQAGDLTVEALRIADGWASKGDNGGGGINNRAGGTLQLDDVLIEANRVDESSQDSDNGGGIANYGTLTILNSSINGNEALDGAGIANYGTLMIMDSSITNNLGCNGGGIVSDNASLTIIRTTIAVNTVHESIDPDLSCGDGGGIATREDLLFRLFNVILNDNEAARGGGLFYSGNENGVITNSTFRYNLAAPDGGGIFTDGELTLNRVTLSNNGAKTYGGGAYNNDMLTLNNVTASGNYAGFGGGLFNHDTGSISMNHCTIASNTATYEGYALGAENGSQNTIHNTILTSDFYGFTCDIAPMALITDLGYNLSLDLSCDFSALYHDQIDTSPALGALGDNGGPTQTMALLWGSPAIDKADPALTLHIDQRSYFRPVDGSEPPDDSSVADIGAFEYASFPPDLFWLPLIMK